MKTTITRYSIIFAAATGLCSLAVADHHKKPVDLAGVWNATASSDAGEREVTWTIKKNEDGYSGTSLDGESGEERDLDRIKVEEKKVTIEMDIEMDGVKGLIRVIAEEKETNKLKGEWLIAGADGTEFMTGGITAVKEVSVPLAGEWAAVSILPDGTELESTLVLSGENAKLEGLFKGENGELEIGKLTAEDKDLRLDFEMEIQGSPMNVVIESELKEDHLLKGKWIVKGADGNEAASGDWSAKREAESDYAGSWNVTAAVPDGSEYTGSLKLSKDEDGYSGSSESSDGTSKELNSVKIDDGKLLFTVDFDANEIIGIITVTAEEKEDGSFSGSWSLASDGNEVATDSWSATKSGQKAGAIKGR